VKEILTSPDVMGYPLNDGGTFYLDVDLSGYGIGAMGRAPTGTRGSRACHLLCK
jgi:hypothetical protein